MKRYIFALIILGTTVFSSCQKDEYFKTLIAKQEGFLSLSSKSYINNAHYSCWETGDLVYINNAETSNTVSVSGESSIITDVTAESPYYALHTNYKVSGYNNGTFSFVIPVNDVYSEDASGHQRINAPMYSYSSTDHLQFHNAFGLMQFNLSYVDANYPILEYIEVQSTVNISGNASINVQSGALQMESSNVFNIRRLIVNQTLTNTSKSFYLPIPPCTNGQFTIRLGFRATNGDKVIYERKSTVGNTMTRNFIATPVQTSNFQSAATVFYGLLSGQFDVSASSKVRFAQGNLRYTTTGTHSVNGGGSDTGAFALSNHQYDFIGSDNANISSPTYTGWIDLFGWGTSGWNSGATCYVPRSTSNDGSEYCPGLDSTNTKNHKNCLTGDYANADWGVYNAISNAGSTPNYLRCFTYAEYNYLKTHNSGIATGSIEVGGNVINGMIILPKVWSLPQGCSFTGGIANNFNTNSYTEAQWQLMEAAGAVFLPAAGHRNGTSFNTSNNYYWSSTSCTSTSSSSGITADQKEAMAVNVSNLNIPHISRSRGSSVRLVKPMNE